MGRRRRWVLAGLVIAALVHAACSSSSRRGTEKGTSVFSFGQFGDTPYSNAEAQAVPRLVDQMNAAGLAFTVFVGDLQGGGRCDNALYTAAIDTFNSFEMPLVYTPGDNEWTDCHQTGQDPIERLTHIRRVMFSTSRSFGRKTLELEQQRPLYPENGRWRIGSVVFVTINVAGSNNNHHADPNVEESNSPRGPTERQAAEAEYQARDQADREWLRQAFVEATRTRAPAVVVLMQADPGFDVPAAERRARRVDGFDNLLAVLVDEAKRYGKPVLVGHGDSHRVTFDQPLLDPVSGQPLPTVYRAESFGSPDVGWVKITVDVRQAKPFAFEDHFVARG